MEKKLSKTWCLPFSSEKKLFFSSSGRKEIEVFGPPLFQPGVEGA